MGVRDGLGFEEVTVDSNLLTTSQDAYFDQVSGANFLAAGSYTGVGCNVTTGTFTTVNATNVSGATAVRGEGVYGTNVSGATSVRGGAATFTSVVATTISGTNIRVDSEGVLHSTILGSPSAFSAKIQAGSGVLDAGSSVWVVYGTAFAGIPTVVATSRDSDTGLRVIAGSITAGSSCVIGVTAADDFNWIAVGI